MRIIIILIAIISIILFYRLMQIEGWVPYKSYPFGNWSTAPNSQVYYVSYRYRKPLYWPYKYKSYNPLIHNRHLE